MKRMARIRKMQFFMTSTMCTNAATIVEKTA